MLLKNKTAVITGCSRGIGKQIVKTLRYVPTKSGWAWRNALGLRNPGIVEGLTKHKSHNVLSIASLENDDWQKLYNLIK